MKYQKIIIFLGVKSNAPSKFKVKDWVIINDDSQGMYKTSTKNLILQLQL